ncbi:MAG: ATP-dependent helicase, partial [Chlorobiaceae bacterium]|nr:ATP-dependent helicase [Chlorobiaceae bacterium]
RKERYRLEVGSTHGVKAGNILGAILNEIGLDPESVGQISIQDSYSTVELPQGMPADVFHELRKVRVCGRQLRLSKVEEDERFTPYGPKKAPKKTGKAPKEAGFFTGPVHKKKRKA